MDNVHDGKVTEMIEFLLAASNGHNSCQG